MIVQYFVAGGDVVIVEWIKGPDDRTGPAERSNYYMAGERIILNEKLAHGPDLTSSKGVKDNHDVNIGWSLIQTYFKITIYSRYLPTRKCGRYYDSQRNSISTVRGQWSL